MDLQILKKAYDASRSFRDHNQDQAADVVGKSPSTINKVLDGSMTSKPTEKAIKTYIYETGLIKSEKELRSYFSKKKVATVN